MIKKASGKYSKRLFLEISNWLKKVTYIYNDNVKRNGSFDIDDVTIEKFVKINDGLTPPHILNVNGFPLELLARKTVDVYINDFDIKKDKVKNKDVYDKIFEDEKVNDTLGVYVYQGNITTAFEGTFFQKHHAILIQINSLEEMKKTLIHELTHYHDYIIAILNLDKYKQTGLYNESNKIYYTPNKNKPIDPEQKYEYEFWSWYNSFLYDISKILKNSHPEHKSLSRIIFNQLFNLDVIDKITEMKKSGKYDERKLDSIIRIIRGKTNSKLGKDIIKSINMMKREVISSDIKKRILKEIKDNENKLENIERQDNDNQNLENNISSLKEYLNELKFTLSYTYFLKKLITDLIKENLLPNNTNFEEYRK